MTALVHNTLESLDRENEFTKYFSKLRANISLISAGLLVSVPFFTEINILIPFYIALFLDFIGLLAIMFISEPKTIHENPEIEIMEKVKNKSIVEIFSECKKLHFLPYIYFSSFLGAIGYAIASYKEIYLISLDFPIIYIGFIAGLSRLIWFFTGHFAHIIEANISFKQLQKYKLLSTSFLFILAGYLGNPYFILILFALDTGAWHGLSSISSRYFLNNYIGDKKYKATTISMQNQFAAVLKIIFPFFFGYIFAYSYSFGFIFAGVFAFVGGVIIWQFLKKTLK